MSYHQFQIFKKFGTEESQIDASIELSERNQRINLLIKQNTYFPSNSPNDLIYSIARTSHLNCYILVCPITYVIYFSPS